MADAKKAEAEEEDKKPAEGGEGTPAAEGEGGAKKSKKKMIIIIAAVAVVVLAAGGGGAAFFLMKGGKENGEGKATAEHASEANDHPVFYPLGDLLVNLAGEGKHPNFLKVKVTLQLAEEKDIPLMDAIKPRIIDNFQVYLRELRIEDLRGSAGMYRLREELLQRVTEAAQPARIRDVLFQEMLVQ
ncbi:MAG: flagellar basal body-associated FliL family protein [Bdellovibrionales bacterium]